MLTVPYEFYKDIYGGSLSENEFNKQLHSVVIDVNYYTSYALAGKSDEDVDAVMLTSYRELCCRLVDMSIVYESNGGVIAKSSSSGKVSETYLESSLPRNRGTATMNLINKFLGRYNLCCRWV